MKSEALKQFLIEVIDEMKGEEIVALDVSDLTAVTDFMVFASGRSSRHVKSIAEKILEKAKESGLKANGVEGLEFGEWVLLDFVDVVVHVMSQESRDFYQLEKLWQAPAA